MKNQTLESLSVVVLSHNRVEELYETFVSLAVSSKVHGFQLIIVDNASTDGSRELIERTITQYPNVVAVMNQENLGVGGGRNSGWRLANRRFVVNLDDDTRIDAEGLANLFQLTQIHKGAGVIFPRMVDSSSQRQLSIPSEVIVSAGNFLGGCHIVNHEAFHQVGELDDDCMFGGEELEYSIRMRASGWDVVYDPSVTVFHNGLPRVGEIGLWRRVEWTRNFLRIHFKYFPFPTAVQFGFRFALSQLLSGSRNFGPNAIPSILRSTFSGARQGYIRRNIVPSEVIAFYRNPDLEPDMGNVPLTRKMRSKLKRAANIEVHQKK